MKNLKNPVPKPKVKTRKSKKEKPLIVNKKALTFKEPPMEIVNLINPKVVNFIYQNNCFDCSAPESNVGYSPIPDVEFTIRYRLESQIVIVDIVNALIDDIHDSDILEELKNDTYVLEVSFCNGAAYLKLHTKPVGLVGSRVSVLNNSDSQILFTRSSISVDVNFLESGFDFVHEFNHGNDKCFYIFTEISGRRS